MSKIREHANAVKHDRKYRGKKSYAIPVWNGILEHASRIGEALWEFLWCLDKITAERDGIGVVLGGAPVKLDTIARDLQSHKRSIRRHVEKLEAAKYIRRRRTPYGHVIEVLNSHKFGIWTPNKRSTQSGHSENREVHKVATLSQREVHIMAPESGHNVTPRVAKNGTYKEDAAKNAASNAAEKQHQPQQRFALPGWVPVGLWNDFIDGRTKKPTDKAKALLVAKLHQLVTDGEDVAQVLMQSIANGWPAFYPVSDPYPVPKREIEPNDEQDSEFTVETIRGQRDRLQELVRKGIVSPKNFDKWEANSRSEYPKLWATLDATLSEVPCRSATS